MKVVLLLALVAVAAGMPAPEAEAEADPQYLLSSPFFSSPYNYVYSYPLAKPSSVIDSQVPLVYSYPQTFPVYSYPYGNFPYGYFPYTSFPLVTKDGEAMKIEAPADAVEEA